MRLKLMVLPCMDTVTVSIIMTTQHVCVPMHRDMYIGTHTQTVNDGG